MLEAADVAAALMPTGTILAYGGASAPAGFRLCDGQTVSRTTFADLFAVIGEAFGAGDGSTTFRLPDLRGRVLAGKDNIGGTAAGRLTTIGNNIGTAGGAETHTLTNSQMPSHTHSFERVGNYGAGAAASGIMSDGVVNAAGYNANQTGRINPAGNGDAHNNVQPTMVVNYLIKT